MSASKLVVRLFTDGGKNYTLTKYDLGVFAPFVISTVNQLGKESTRCFGLHILWASVNMANYEGLMEL